MNGLSADLRFGVRLENVVSRKLRGPSAPMKPDGTANAEDGMVQGMSGEAAR